MSYICQKCGATVPDRVPQNLTIVKTRDKNYYHLVVKNPVSHKKEIYNYNSFEERQEAHKKFLENKYEIIRQWTTKGSEIVKEMGVCPQCQSRSSHA